MIKTIKRLVGFIVYALTPFFLLYWAYQLYMVIAFLLGFHKDEFSISIFPNNVLMLVFCSLIISLFIINKKIKSLKSSKSKLN